MSKTYPSTATIKRLFAVSGNYCAFPKCPQPLVHGEKVTGKLCHIRAANEGGPRFDPTQTNEERHAFDNLVLMCPIHHDVIDADVIAYTVERLIQIKIDHEAKESTQPELSDEIAKQFIVDLSGAKVTNGSIIITQNQTGGQVGHIIKNYGPPKREVTTEMREKIFATLRQVSPRRIGFASTQGDMEAHEFKEQLMEVFRLAGWQVVDMRTFMFFGAKYGIVLTIPSQAQEEGVPQIVAQALSATGNPISGSKGDMANECGIYVQVWRAPDRARR